MEKVKKEKTVKPSLKVYVDVYTKKEIHPADRIRIGVGAYIDKSTVVYISGTPFSIYSKDITKDVFYNNYNLTGAMSQVVISDVSIPGKPFEYGYTIKAAAKVNYIQPGGSLGQCYMLPEHARSFGIIEDFKLGQFYVKELYKPTSRKIYYHQFPRVNFEKTEKNLIAYGEKSPTNLISEGKPYTFGLEIETCLGTVPKYASHDLNISCAYDGSVLDNNGKKNTGGEYITGVLYGDAGFRQVHKICGELSKRCEINNTCSVHVHLGNTIFNKELIVLIWKLNQMLQTELYSMMPPSRLKREHCQAIKTLDLNFNNNISYELNIDRYYSEIIRILSLGKTPSKTINKEHNHPAGKTCGYDRRTPRYWWLNFIPAVFNLKGKGNYTIEFRMHSGTLNFEKIKNWILICMGILAYCENNKSNIIQLKKGSLISLSDVMMASFPTKGKYLSEYIEARKELFTTGQNNDRDFNEKKEYIGRVDDENQLPSTLRNVVT